MIPRALLVVTLLAGCEKESSRPTAPPDPPAARVPVSADAGRADGVTAIELPVAKPIPEVDPGPRLVVSLPRSGAIYLGGREVVSAADGKAGKLDALVQELGRVRGQGRDGVWIEADDQLPYSAVVGVMAAIERAGIDQIKLLTDADHAEPPRPPPPKRRAP